MRNKEKSINWIEKGKQIGHVFSFDLHDEKCWSSVGVQKMFGKYIVYIDEIVESQMDSENYLKEIWGQFSDYKSVISFIDANSHCSVWDLKPCIGQKVFNSELFPG